MSRTQPVCVIFIFPGYGTGDISCLIQHMVGDYRGIDLDAFYRGLIAFRYRILLDNIEHVLAVQAQLLFREISCPAVRFRKLQGKACILTEFLNLCIAGFRICSGRYIRSAFTRLVSGISTSAFTCLISGVSGFIILSSGVSASGFIRLTSGISASGFIRLTSCVSAA